MTKLTLKNPRLPGLPSVAVSALADTGAVYLSIPESLANQLQLEQIETRIATLADGRSVEVPYVGPIELHFKNRSGFTGALVMGDQVILGVIPMEDMDLVLLPKSRSIDVNPASPDRASCRL